MGRSRSYPALAAPFSGTGAVPDSMPVALRRGPMFVTPQAGPAVSSGGSRKLHVQNMLREREDVLFVSVWVWLHGQGCEEVDPERL
jgi:hypothetical protein